MIAEGLERETRSFVPTASTFDWWRENVQNEVAERAGRDGWREIIGVRSIDSSLAVRARGRRRDAETRRGKSEKEKWRDGCVKLVAGFHSIHISINPPIPPSTRPQVNASSLLAKVSLGRPPVVIQALKARNALNKTAGTLCFLRSRKPNRSLLLHLHGLLNQTEHSTTAHPL